MLCLKEMHRYSCFVVCGGKRFAVSPWNQENSDFFFTAGASQNTWHILPQSCLKLMSAKDRVQAGPKATSLQPGALHLGVGCLLLQPLCPGAQACAQLLISKPICWDAECILKGGNGCPGTLQGQDKARAERHFYWKMCFACNCNRHHLWLLMRTNCL